MNRRLTGLLMAAIVLPAVSAGGATINRDANSLTYAGETGAGHIEMSFRKCMANDLFTFHTVMLDGKLMNSAAHSDNIGPFLVDGHGWIGGNHLSDSGNLTARTVDVSVCADGLPLASGTRQADTMEVTVTNELLMPDGSTFATETMRYLVAGNSIEVRATHRYGIAEDVTVDRYYGMQSMFEGESHILIPAENGRCSWIGVVPGGTDNAIRLFRGDVPHFSAFVERGDNGYQACYMLPEDLGTRSCIDTGDVVFIGNSYGKCYHKLMGTTKLHPGDVTRWHGVYSWFGKPDRDTFADNDDDPVFRYPAYIGGEPVTITIDGSGRTAVIPMI